MLIMIDVLDKYLLRRNEQRFSIRTLYHEEGVYRAFIHIDQCTQMAMLYIFGSKAYEVLPTVFAISTLLGIRLREIHLFIGKDGRRFRSIDTLKFD